MDLKAYVQIEEYEKLLKQNNINIPRLRGIDPCVSMKPWPQEEYRREKESISSRTCENLCTAKPFWSCHPEYYSLDSWTDILREYYMFKSGDAVFYDGIRWERIHGWKRKVLKTAIHNNIRKFERYVATWNKYCGCENVIRIHSRIGGGNWIYYGGPELSRQSWFIEKVDDYFDFTYCDIYVRVGLDSNLESVVGDDGSDEEKCDV